MLLLRELLKGIDAATDLPLDLPIEEAAPFETARAGQLAFLDDPRKQGLISACGASAILVGRDFPLSDAPTIRVDDPRKTFLTLMALFALPESLPEGIHETAVIEPDARLEEGVRVGALCYIGSGARVERDSCICPQVYIGPNVTVGSHCLVRAGVRLERGTVIGNRVIVHGGAVIGSDGFGFSPHENGIEKEPQLGFVHIGNDVEIGANTTIDRATIAGTATEIGDGTKIDNLVQIGHNCRVGRYCLIAGHVGISGSVDIGDGVVIGGQAGIRDHVKVGNWVRLAGRAAVSRDVPDGATYSGYPAQDHRQELRQEAALRRLPELRERVAKLEKRLVELERAIRDGRTLDVSGKPETVF